MHQHHLEHLTQLLGLLPRDSDPGGLELGPIMYISNKFPVMLMLSLWGPPLENYTKIHKGRKQKKCFCARVFSCFLSKKQWIKTCENNLSFFWGNIDRTEESQKFWWEVMSQNYVIHCLCLFILNCFIFFFFSTNFYYTGVY